MTRGDEGVSVRLDTQHEATATIVHAAQGKLVEDLRQQGVRVAGTEVICTPNETGRDSQDQRRASAQAPAHLIETARSEEHTSELQSLMCISYAVLCLNKQKTKIN